ncbi:type II toxin-antitoxin system VapC family toxin [Candidatus Woesearchaeota archaeon]|nr:type II toxin-antitoxin system VapC family toxin [Candidatus Woesearchaeota archaeon]
MERQKKVLDASVLLKLFVHEEGSDIAHELCRAHTDAKAQIIVPELAFLEILNVLRYKKKNAQSLSLVNERLFELQFHVEKISQYLIEHAVRLAIEHDLSVYDAIYLALARLHGCPLYTADHKLGKCTGTILLGDKP